ncbi:MAG: hypothetical protein ACE5FM_03135 [Methyloligellaceae bacterium]
MPVFAYWLAARSHPNAIAGLMPWNDANLYFSCGQQILLDAELSLGCGMRPYYTSFIASLLWLAGNDLQIALVLQAIVIGAAVCLFVRQAARHLDGPATLAVYAVLFLFAGLLCSNLTMTENAGLVLGAMALAILWGNAGSMTFTMFTTGMFIMGVAQSARAGALLILPALLAWVLMNAAGPAKQRIVMAAGGGVAAVAGFAAGHFPTLLWDGEFGTSQSNLAYLVYAIAAGGKSYLQASVDYPDLFRQGYDQVELTQRIYRLAFDSIAERPLLFLWGCLRAFIHHFYDQFRLLSEFFALRIFLILLWVIGLLTAVIRRQCPHQSMLLWLFVGILLSAPILTFNGGNRLYAATYPVDALFVGYGLMWVSRRLAIPENGGNKTGWRPGSAAVLLTAALLPLAIAAIIQKTASPRAYVAPRCPEGQTGIVVQSGRSTIALAITGPGAQSVYPLRVRQDYFGNHMHHDVYGTEELRSYAAGTVLLRGIRLDQDAYGEPIRFFWHGAEPTFAKATGFCIEFSAERRLFSPARSIEQQPVPVASGP